MTWQYEELHVELFITLGLIYLFVMRAFLVWVVNSVPNIIPQPHFILKYIAPCMAMPIAILLWSYVFLPPHVVPPMVWPLRGPPTEIVEII